MDLKFLTAKSAALKSHPDRRGKRTLLLLESGRKVASVLSRSDLLEKTSHVISFISHWHPDHFQDVVKVQILCESLGIPLSFLDYFDSEIDSDKLYENLKQFGVKRPDMISRKHAEKDMDLTLETEKLVHGNTYSRALIMKDPDAKERSVKIFLPDNNDVTKSHGLFSGGGAFPLEDVDMLCFDVTHKPQASSIHLSINSVEKFKTPYELRKRFVAWHYPAKGAKQLQKDIKTLGYADYADHRVTW